MMKKLVPFLLVLLGCGGQADGGANKQDERCPASCAGQSSIKTATTCGGMSGSCSNASGGTVLPSSTAMGNGAMGNGAMGNGAMGNGAMGNGAMGNTAMASSLPIGGKVGTSSPVMGGVGSAATGRGGGSDSAGAASALTIGGHAGHRSVSNSNFAGAGTGGKGSYGGSGNAGQIGTNAGHAGTAVAMAGVAGSYAHRSDRARCGAVECDAWATPSGFANCCYANDADSGCGTSNDTGCLGFPASLLHCDSGGDCSRESSPMNRRCIFEVAGRRAFCGGAVPNATTQIQLCEPGEACFVGSCQPTTLDGRLPPDYWACVP